MIHAFNQKNVRRVLMRDDQEHTVEKTEDAITSMVFSPLAFMSAPDALRCLQAIVGTVGEGVPCSHLLELWPQGLKAIAADGAGLTRCEPDLLVTFTFPGPREVIYVGEVKWDWRMQKADFARELGRERRAVRRRTPASQVQFAIAKYPPARQINHVPIFRWAEILTRVNSLSKEAASGAPQIWAQLTSAFLEKVDVAAFGGFPVMNVISTDWAKERAFWQHPYE